MSSGKVYFVGGGPGDPELLTLRAHRIIGQASIIIYTGSLLDQGLFAHARADAEIHDSAGLHLEQLVELMVGRARDGKLVARVHSGDPSIFGAIHEQMVALERAGVAYEVIPGVCSAFAAAAALGQELTVPELAQTVILTRAEGRTPMPSGQRLGELACHRATVAVFLSATLIDRVVAELSAGYVPETPVAVVANASRPDQRIVRGTLGDIAAKSKAAGIRAQAMILVGAALDPAIKQRAGERKSRLYDPSFSHGFRKRAPDREKTAGAQKPGEVTS
jgi:precorrin-4/cobalt-precorrin-4 C11-methyltransferase